MEHKDIIVINGRIPAISHITKCKPAGKEITKSFTPTQIAEIYGFPSSSESRVNIGIIELGGGYHSSDLDTYWSYLGLKTKPNVVPISVDGATNSPGGGADAEVVLDIEVVGGIVPNSNIYVYFAPNSNQGFYDAIHTAVYDTVNKPSIISISWGAPENYWTTDQMNAFNSLFQAATAKGINICVASGDNGAKDGESGKQLHVDFPSSSPYVLACGGTTLTCPSLNYSDSSTKEICWGSSKGGPPGGGYSSIFSTPPYQSSLGIKTRGVPDVCGVADPNTGWIIYLNGEYQVVGGTSAVAPMWAAYLALTNVITFINPILYNNSSSFHDIIAGNNQGYKATKGWDPATGLGSPNGSVLNSKL